MREVRLLLLWVLCAALVGCDGGRGRLRIKGEMANLDVADFLIFSPDGGLSDIDTLHLTKGRFSKDLPLEGGPYQFTVVYPNYATLTFLASEGQTVEVRGDALALSEVTVEGADSVIPQKKPVQGKRRIEVGKPLPKTTIVSAHCERGKYLLVGFGATWKGGSASVTGCLRRAAREAPDSMAALYYSLDADASMLRFARPDDGAWDVYADHELWESADVKALGLRNIPLFILLDPKGRVLAFGKDYSSDIEPSMRKLRQQQRKETPPPPQQRSKGAGSAGSRRK